ncbi:hypothetical protein KR044_004860, partial [Drosophila immigrans]
ISHLLLQLLCLAVVCVQGSGLAPEARSATPPDGKKQLSAPVGVLDSVLRGKSRQSRCVRCYEDRYYSSGSDRYGGYSSRAAEDPRSSWYYSYDRYDDRSSDRDRDRGRDYDRYYGRDDRYSPRTYDRYEGRGYDDYYRRGSSYDRGSSYAGSYAGYDTRDRYYGDRYSDSSRDRYYDRSRTGYNSYDKYDKYDPYDRYYSRYDFRNYRPWDETYRGQSGFDNSGRGYYFAGDGDDTRSGSHPFYDRERASSSSSPASPASPCGHLISNCPYGDRGIKVASSAIGSDGYRGGHTSVMGDMGKPSGPGGWTYLGDQDKQSSRGGGSGSNNNNNGGNNGGSNISIGGVNGAAGVAPSGGGGGGRDRERDAQSASYGGRPRPLGGSYLFDRDSNAVPEGPSDAANSNGDGPGDGSHKMPAAAAQTAPAPNAPQSGDKEK